jgi:TrfB plasmid transcriptional repressor
VKLDATALKLLTQKRRFNAQTLEIAKRRVLGEESATALAAEYGVNLRRIYAIEKQIIAAWRELHLPPGWSEISLVAPKSLIAEFKRRTLAARKELLRKNTRRIQASARSKQKTNGL